MQNCQTEAARNRCVIAHSGQLRPVSFLLRPKFAFGSSVGEDKCYGFSNLSVFCTLRWFAHQKNQWSTKKKSNHNDRVQKLPVHRKLCTTRAVCATRQREQDCSPVHRSSVLWVDLWFLLKIQMLPVTSWHQISLTLPTKFLLCFILLKDKWVVQITLQQWAVINWSWISTLVAHIARVPVVKTNELLPLFEPFCIHQIPEKKRRIQQ